MVSEEPTHDVILQTQRKNVMQRATAKDRKEQMCSKLQQMTKATSDATTERESLIFAATGIYYHQMTQRSYRAREIVRKAERGGWVGVELIYLK